MTLAQFARLTGLYDKTEIGKTRLLAFYLHEQGSQRDFTINEIAHLFDELRMAEPNTSRLKAKVTQSKQFIRGKRAASFALPAGELSSLRSEYPDTTTKSEEVVAPDTVLPESLFAPSRGYIESLARQINASYHGNIFDGCAVLMRRLLEILLILSYEKLGIDSSIRDPVGNYVMLERIITDAKSNSTLSLSRNSREAVDVFRALGNFSAHKIMYNARRSDIQVHIINYRALVEELLYKSGIRT